MDTKESVGESVQVSITSLSDEDLLLHPYDATKNSVQSSSPQQVSSEQLQLSDHFSDIFGDTFNSSKSNADSNLLMMKGDDQFFILEGKDDEYSFPTWGGGDNSTIDNLEQAARNDGISGSSSLFDDLLDFDFSSPRSSEIDTILQDNIMANPAPVPKVDLLFGVDDDLISPTEFQTDVKVNTPDILDFVEIQHDLPEVTNMDVTDGLTCETLNDGWNLVSEVSPPIPPNMGQSPDIVVTSAGTDRDHETARGEDSKKESEDEKTDENINEKTDDKSSIEDTQNKADTSKDGVNNQEIDFSVLQLPETSTINFDSFKHKRSLSQKGSMANRKKPKRITVHPNSEDNIYVDSTEPKPHKPQPEDEPENVPSPNHSKEDKPQEAESDVTIEASPSRKLTGGIKIPGLLEGLSKSKAFNKIGNASPETEPEIVPHVTSEMEKSPRSQQATITTSPPQVIRPKPVVLPRVLPKPINKTVKETQNLTTASSGVVRASSFKITSAGSVVAEQPSFLKSSTALSRSASVKITGASTNKNQEQATLTEIKAYPFGTSILSPPNKQGDKNSALPTASKSINKTPPPVPTKPSVAPKPAGASSRLSASFVGVKPPLPSPLKSETKPESHITPDLPKPDTIMNGRKEHKPSTAATIEHKPKTDTPLITDRKPYSFAPKTMEKHSSPATPEKIDSTIDNINSDSGKLEAQNQVSLSRIPSLKKPLTSGYVANAGFKVRDNSINIEAKKTDSFDIDDVFVTNTVITDKSCTSVSASDSSSLYDGANAADEFIHRRKSSITGVTPVKSPLGGDKPPSGAIPRKGSITGSAYNPIGFRSTIGSSDSEQRSRGSSFSSTHDGVASVDPLTSVSAPSIKPRADSPFDTQRLRDGLFNSSASEQVQHTPNKTLESGSGKTDAKPNTTVETKLTPSFLTKRGDDKTKEAVSETKKVYIQEQTRTMKGTINSSTINGSPAITKGGLASDTKSSPWNVQLKKVEKKEPPKRETINKTEDSQPAWRKQLSLRSRNPPPQQDAEKPKQDTTPDWAKASINRRQRLIESGVIRGDS